MRLGAAGAVLPLFTISYSTDEGASFEILDDLTDVRADCYLIGTQLKLKASTIKLIRAESLNHTEATERIITEWLRRNYNVERFGPPMWKALVEAVAHPGGGNHVALAMEIASRHKGR